EPLCPFHLGLHVVARDEACRVLYCDPADHRVDLAAACKLDLLERGPDAGELELDGLLLGHLAELLEFVEPREPDLAPVIRLGLEFSDHCFRDDYCRTFVFTGLYHRSYAPVNKDACIWYQYHKILLPYSVVLMVCYTILSVGLATPRACAVLLFRRAAHIVQRCTVVDG